MHKALYSQAPNARGKAARSTAVCPVRAAEQQRWLVDLPHALKALVVPPVRLDVHREYEMQAERIQGRDAGDAPCFNEVRYVLTALRSDDDEVFYEAPVYAETLTAWRLIDARWLICKTTVNRNACQPSQTHFSVSDHMPR